MPLIEGVGDEVVQFACVVLVVVVAVLAWWSTNAHPDRYRALLIMRSRAHHPVTISIRTRSNLMITHHSSEEETMNSRANNEISSSSPEEGPSQGARVIPLQEMDSIIDADMAMLDNNRLHFYRRMDSPNNTQASSAETSINEENEAREESEPASTEQIREMDSIVSAMEAEVTTECDFFTRPSQSTSSTSTETKAIQNVGEKSESSPADNVNSEESNANDEQAASAGGDESGRRILIKLKYLNDTLKEVEGSLDELLKDFKRRHFSTELSRSHRVRLIFQGRALSDEAATLRACGLHHRAVVHCLVHPNRANNQAHNPSEETPLNAGGEAGGGAAAPERAWDLENILMTLVSVALTVVWFFRCEYSNMFTASASVALFGLTVFYSVAIFGLYLSDTFHLDRRPAPAPAAAPAPQQPAANN